MSTTAPMRKLLALLYLAGFVVLLDQVADVTANVLLQPVAAGTATWRFGVFGMAASRASMLLLADVLIFIAAVGLEHRVMLRILALGHFLLAAVVLAGLGLFALDTLEIQRMVRAEGKQGFGAAAGRAAVLALLGAALLLWAGGVAWVAGRGHRREHRSGGSPLVVPVTPEPPK